MYSICAFGFFAVTFPKTIDKFVLGADAIQGPLCGGFLADYNKKCSHLIMDYNNVVFRYFKTKNVSCYNTPYRFEHIQRKSSSLPSVSA